MTTRPTLSPNRSDGYVVPATDYNNDILQQGNWAQEVILGTNTDKIPATAIAGVVGYYPNLLVNGGMEIDQRNSGSAYTVTAANQVTLDKWIAIYVATGGTPTAAVQRSTTADVGSQFSAAFNYAQAGTSNGFLFQNVENYKEFLGKTVFLSARVSANATLGFMYITDGIGQANTATTVNGGGFQTLTASLTVSNSATVLQVVFKTTGTIFANIDNVMLAQNTSQIDYIQRPPAEEQVLCERYYQKLKVSQRWRTSTVSEPHEVGVIYRVPMTAAPSVAITPGTHTNIASASAADIGTNGLRYALTATATTTDTSAQSDILTLDCGAV